MGYIYILKNKINKKKYVGQTSQKDVRNRIWVHKSVSKIKKGFYLHNSIRKYGWNNFNCMSFYCPIYLLDIIEKILIFLLNTSFPNGYNLIKRGHKNKKLSKEVKRKISESHKKFKGKKAPMYGKKHSKETIEKMKLAQKGKKNHFWRKTGDLHPRSKAVICIDKNKYYGSILEASRKTKIRPSFISNCCKGKRKEAGGYHWRFVNVS